MMTILTVDPELNDLKALTQSLSRLYPEDEVVSFSDPLMALQYAEHQPIDVLYAAADMKRLAGTVLAQRLREKQPLLRVFLVAADEAYRLDALQIKADGYLIKPISVSDIMQEEMNQR